MQITNPTAVVAGSGEARWWMGALAEIKATAADTGGLLTLIEVTCGPGYATPLHVHHREDEAFWILDGEATFVVGETTLTARAGDYAFGPRDVPHQFSVGDQGCRLLFILTPGGFEDLVRATSEPAGNRELPPAGAPPDFDWMRTTVARYGCELLASPQ